jgi:uncharacterized protein (DUF433 family)
MTLPLTADPLPIHLEPSGAMRIGTTRVTLESVIRAHRHGLSPEQIVEQYDTLILGDVYSVISYYLHHRRELDEYVVERERNVDRLEAEALANGQSPTGLRKRLEAKLAGNQPPCSP